MGQLLEAMTWLGQQPDVIFLGQSVAYPGAKMHTSLEGVPPGKRVEMPVAENLQLGISIGLSLESFVPVSVFPRLNFLLCAMDQLVNHLDKLPLYSSYRPKVIIRTAIGSKQPLDAGPQHTGDRADAIADMLETVQVQKVHTWLEEAVNVYQEAYKRPLSTLIVEK